MIKSIKSYYESVKHFLGKHGFDYGQYTLCFGQSMIGKDGAGSGHEDGFRFQLYWPHFKIKNWVKKPNSPSYVINHKELYVRRHQQCLGLFSQMDITVLAVRFWGLGLG